MSSLSWLIYFASVSDSMRNSWDCILVVTMIATIVFSVTFLLFRMIEREEIPYYGTYMKWALPLIVISFLFSSLLPKKETIMLIAASEFGDRIMTQQKIGERIVDPSITLLQEWIKNQIAEISSGKKK